MLPDEYINLDRQSKAFIIASLEVRRDAEDKEMKKAKSKAK